MIRFNRTTEYGLLALRHISRKGTGESAEVTSAREIADCYGLPFEITAKTLQRLRDYGFIHSAHGARGGYTLFRPLQDVTLAEFLRLMEGPQAVVHCVSESSEAATSDDCACEYSSKCDMQDFMSALNSKVVKFLSGIRLSEITDGSFLGANFRELPQAMPVAVGEEP